MRIAAMFISLSLAACGAGGYMSLEAAESKCADRARASMGPTGSVSVGLNSKTGVSTGARIGVSSDFLMGKDPQEVYFSCMQQLTGQPPVSALQL